LGLRGLVFNFAIGTVLVAVVALLVLLLLLLLDFVVVLGLLGVNILHQPALMW
jgi:hypothetical protein